MRVDPQPWAVDAACLDHEPDVFVDVDRDLPVEALRVCRGCPVRIPCLEYALAMPHWEDAGVWGGTTEKTRRDIRTGVVTRDRAMRRGDEQSERRSRQERLQEDEPWLVVR